MNDTGQVELYLERYSEPAIPPSEEILRIAATSEEISRHAAEDN
jgi:hypothetical protein